MKKILLFLTVAVISMHSFGQKAKKASKSASKVNVLAKSENVTAALLDYKGSYGFYLLSAKSGKTDSLLIKASVNKAPESLPANCKLSSFSAKGDKLYLVSWIEKTVTGDPKARLENAVETHSEIWDINLKSALFSNTQKVINITEIVYLDPGKNASKTVEKVRRDGFEFTLSPEGDVTLKNKTQQDRLSYDAASKKFLAVKSAPAPAKKK